MYTASKERYSNMNYNHCGRSGLKLPMVSLGLWHNFGSDDDFENMENMLKTAFDLGITHFDLANNYGPLPGAAEENFGKILKNELNRYRDQLIISSKAGYAMWEGPYGDFGSKKYMTASLDQSLERTGLDYFDIFYSHRPDPSTPIEETMEALALAVKQGKILYIGISNYNAAQTIAAVKALGSMGLRCLIHQHAYSMFNRTSEKALLDILDNEGIGSIAFSPLAQGVLTDKYLSGIPKDSRAAKGRFLKAESITEEKLTKVKLLSDIAAQRGQSLAQLALTWVLRKNQVNSVLIGASSPEQIRENAMITKQPPLTFEETEKIHAILKSST